MTEAEAKPPSIEELAAQRPVAYAEVRERESEMLQAEWLIRPWLQSLRVALLYGDSSVGKTWLALLWALMLAVEGLRVLIVEGEGMLQDTFNRLRLIAKGQGFSEDAIEDRVFIWQNSGLDLRQKQDVERLTTRATGFDLVVVDTLSAHAAGSDEGASEFGLIMAGLKRLQNEAKTTVLAAHHVTKEASRKGKANMSNASGHSNLKRFSDVMVEVIGEEPTQHGRIRFGIHNPKQRTTEKAKVTYCELRIDSEGAVFTWDERPAHTAPAFTEADLQAFLGALPGPEEAPIGLERVGAKLKKRQETLRRLARVALQQERIEWLKTGPQRGLRRAVSSSTSTTRPPPVPHPSRTGAPGGVEHPSQTTRPVPLLEDGWDGCSPGGSDGTSVEGAAVRSQADDDFGLTGKGYDR